MTNQREGGDPTNAVFDRLVLVEWIDAWSEDGWHGTQEAHKMASQRVVCYSVGYVVQEDEEGILLSSAITKDGFGALWLVPNGMIMKVTTLTEGSEA